MICRPCATRADTEGKCTRTCGDPGCTCQHDHPWEQDPDNRPDIPAYVDGLPPGDPRRIAYEEHAHRKIES